MSAPTDLDLYRARNCAHMLADAAASAVAVMDDPEGLHRHRGFVAEARKRLADIADALGLELTDPDAEDAVTLRDAVMAWRGYADASADRGMTFGETQEAFKGPFPLHHKLVFGKACDAPAAALAAE